MCVAASLVSAQAQEALTWQQCLERSQRSHPGLIASLEAVAQQQAQVSIEQSGALPQVSATADASTRYSSTTSSQTDSTTRATQDTYSYGVAATQLIFDGANTARRKDAASAQVAAAQQAYRFASSEVRFALRTAFIEALKYQTLISVMEDIVKIRRDNLMLITLQYESGLEHRGALLASEANLAAAEAELAQAKRGLVRAQRQLAKEMGQAEGALYLVSGDFTVRDQARIRPDFAALLKDNPSLLQAAARRQAAGFSERAARAGFAPEVSARASAEKSSGYWPPNNSQWSLGVGVSVPVFEGGLQGAQLSQAKAALRQSQAQEHSARDTALVALEISWAQLQDALDNVEVQRKLLEAAQERSRIAQAQYATGFIDFDNWIIIENDLVNAKKASLESQAAALAAEAAWVQAKGVTLEYAG